MYQKSKKGLVVSQDANPIGLTPHFLMGGEPFALFS